MTRTYVSGELLPRVDTVRLCLRGLTMDRFVLSEPFLRCGRRISHLVSTPPRVYTVDGSPSGVVVQLNGSELRVVEDPEAYVSTAISGLVEHWRDISMPRIDWAVQLAPERYSLDDVVRLAIACGYAEAEPTANRMRYVVGSAGVTRYLYYSYSRTTMVAGVRRCSVDRAELLAYTATCDQGLPWLRVESREYVSSREPGYHALPITQALMLELGSGLVIPESEALRAVAPDRTRSTRRALSMLMADPSLPDGVLAELAHHVYGPLLPTSVLLRFDRLRRFLAAGKKSVDLDVAIEQGSTCAASGTAKQQSEVTGQWRLS